MTIGVFLCLLILSFPSLLIASPDSIDYNPFPTRDQNLFNLIHGQPLPTNARLSKKAQSQWSSSLAITNTLNFESSINENIYLDYEAYRFNLSYQYGLSELWNLKIDIPVIHQSGGNLDSSIDNWHEFFGLPRANRPFVDHDQYELLYENQTKPLLNLNEASTTLGDLQIAIARSIIEDNNSTLSFWTSLKLPTGDKNKLSSNGAADFSAWLALNQQLSEHWLINLNTGAVILGKDNYLNIPLSDYALYGHIMLGWLVTENINIKVQLQGHTSYYDQSQLKVLSDTYFLSFGTSIKINRCQLLNFAVSEDIKVDASPDASFLINWHSYPSRC